jgi:hypothetical protein
VIAVPVEKVLDDLAIGLRDLLARLVSGFRWK